MCVCMSVTNYSHATAYDVIYLKVTIICRYIFMWFWDILHSSGTVKAEIITRKKFVRIRTSRRSAYNLKRAFIAPTLSINQSINSRAHLGMATNIHN